MTINLNAVAVEPCRSDLLTHFLARNKYIIDMKLYYIALTLSNNKYIEIQNKIYNTM